MKLALAKMLFGFIACLLLGLPQPSLATPALDSAPRLSAGSADYDSLCLSPQEKLPNFRGRRGRRAISPLLPLTLASSNSWQKPLHHGFNSSPIKATRIDHNSNDLHLKALRTVVLLH